MKFETILKFMLKAGSESQTRFVPDEAERAERQFEKLRKKLLNKFWQAEQKVWDLEQEILDLKRQHERELENAEKEAFERGFDEAFSNLE